MKYNYTILAQGELEENKLSKILEENGLKVELIEIIPDVKSLVQEQSNNAEPCLLDKWEELCKQKIVEREDLRDNVRKSLVIWHTIISITTMSAQIKIAFENSLQMQRNT